MISGSIRKGISGVSPRLDSFYLLRCFVYRPFFGGIGNCSITIIFVRVVDGSLCMILCGHVPVVVGLVAGEAG